MNSDPNEMSDAPEARWTKARNMPWTVGQELRRRLAWLLVRDRSPTMGGGRTSPFVLRSFRPVPQSQCPHILPWTYEN